MSFVKCKSFDFISLVIYLLSLSKHQSKKKCQYSQLFKVINHQLYTKLPDKEVSWRNLRMPAVCHGETPQVEHPLGASSQLPAERMSKKINNII